MAGRKRCTVALDVLFDSARRAASKLSNGICRHRVEIGSVDLIQSEKELDAPWSETARLKLRAALLGRHRIVVDWSSQHLCHANGHFRPRKGEWPHQNIESFHASRVR